MHTQVHAASPGVQIVRSTPGPRFDGEVSPAQRATLETRRAATKPLQPASDEHLADRFERLLAAFIDGAIAAAAAAVIYLPLTYFSNLSEEIRLSLMAVGLGAVEIVQVLLIARTGQTIGKKIFEIRIVDHEQQTNPGFFRAVVLRRWAFTAVGVVPLVGGLINALDLPWIFGRERRCLHDHLADTKVVKARNDR